MNFFIVKETEVALARNFEPPLFGRNASVSLQATPTEGELKGQDLEFKQRLERYVKDIQLDISLQMALTNEKNQKNKMTVRLSDTQLRGTLDNLLNDDLAKCIRLKVQCNNIQLNSTGVNRFDFSTPELKIKGINALSKCFVEASVTAPKNFFNFWKQRNNLFSFLLSVVVCLKTPQADVILPPGTGTESRVMPVKVDEPAMVKKTRRDDDEEVELISGHGTSRKCHKSYLAAHSALARRRFQDCEHVVEVEMGPVRFLELQDDSMDALLTFFHYGEVKAAENDCRITFELLCAAYKHEMSLLQEVMTHLFLKKSEEDQQNRGRDEGERWFSVDVAVKLFMFARFVMQDEKLDEISVKFLKSKDRRELEKCEAFQALFREDADTATSLYGP